MTFEEYVTAAETRRREKPNERRGQAYSNALFYIRPDIVEEVNGTYLDPFYNDSVIGEFLTFVMVQW